jgi:precorrin-6A/cobalt-precorrin-6A reductase
VLPSADSLRRALAVGLPPNRLAVVRPRQGQPPGGLEQALCRRWSISDVLCRQSGGDTESLWRVITSEQGLRLWLLRRPQEPPLIETVVGVQALLRRLQHDHD